MDKPDHHTQWSAWRACNAVCLCLICIAVLWTIDIALSPHKQAVFYIAIGGLVISVALWIVLQAMGSSPGPWPFFLLICQVVVWSVAVLLNHNMYFKLNLTLWYPFIGLKVLALILALAAPPPLWPAWICFAVIGVAPVVQYYGAWGADEHFKIGAQEPWITVAFVACCIFLWMHRWKALVSIRREEQMATKAAMYERFAHLLLGAQHLTNTPLQIIDANLNLLNLEYPQAKQRFQKIQQGLAAIHRIGALLAFGEQRIKWDHVELPSTIDDLEKRIEDIRG